MDSEDMYNEDHFEGKDYGHKELDAMFQTLLHPPNLILQFKHMDEFAEWTRTGTIDDIDEMRKEFEKFELYGYLIVIRDILIEKRMEEEMYQAGIDILPEDGIIMIGEGTPPGTQLKLEL